MYKVKIRRVFRTGLHHSSSSVIKCTTILSKQTDSSVRHWFSSKFTAARPPFSTWLLRNWVESKSRPIREKTPCSEKSRCLTVANLDFDFEIGNSEVSLKHEIQKRFSTLRNPFSRWISIKRSSSGSHEFLCFAFFREIQKGSPLRGVSLRLTVGYKKKKRTDFSASKSVFALHFLQQNPLSLFQNFNPDLPIESTQNFRAVFPIFHKFTRLFWTLLNRNKIIFIRPTAFRLFDHLIKAILGSKFLQNWLIHA